MTSYRDTLKVCRNNHKASASNIALSVAKIRGRGLKCAFQKMERSIKYKKMENTHSLTKNKIS